MRDKFYWVNIETRQLIIAAPEYTDVLISEGFKMIDFRQFKHFNKLFREKKED